MDSQEIGSDDDSTANQSVTNEGIDGFLTQGTQELAQVMDLESLEQWRLRHLGRSSAITVALRGLANLAIDQRRAIGAAGNVARKSMETLYESNLAALKKTAIEANPQGSIDITMPGRVPEVGRLHPTIQMVREIADSFSSMGFQVLEGPEVEWDKYNFESLNIPQDHPARDMWDTLWIKN